MLEVYREIVNRLLPTITKQNATEHRIEFVTGGVLEFWTLEDLNAGRGRRYHRVIIDEAAKARHLQQAWTEAIRPTLTDFKGDALFMSTPKGLNYFYTLYQYGLDDNFSDWHSWQFNTYQNPYIDNAEIDAAKIDLPAQVFAQEYLAEFVADGSLIQNVNACATAPDNQQWIVQGRYVIGVDWGKLDDFTVATVLDAKTMTMVEMLRFNKIDYVYQAQRIKELYQKWKPTLLLVETNSIGEPMLDQLNHDGVPAKGFTTTQISKAQIINQLILAFEKKSIKILNDQILKAELQAYEAIRLPGGGLKYGAPPGFHDDTVMSLAIAVQACANVPVMVLQQESDPYGIY